MSVKISLLSLQLKMNWLLKLLGIFSLTLVVLCSDVLDFSGPDFEDRVTEHEAILIEFFAPWYVVTLIFLLMA